MKARHSLASCNLQAFSETFGAFATGEMLQCWVPPRFVADLLREEKGLRSNVVIPLLRSVNLRVKFNKQRNVRDSATNP
jgi:hypothetical protein